MVPLSRRIISLLASRHKFAQGQSATDSHTFFWRHLSLIFFRMNVKRHTIVQTYFHYSCIVYHNDIADPILAATIQITTVGYHTIGQSRSQTAKFGMPLSCLR